MLLKALVGALIYEVALELVNMLLDTRKTRYIARLLILPNTHLIV